MPTKEELVYQAYKAGKLSPDALKKYENDIASGDFTLPEGVFSLNPPTEFNENDFQSWYKQKSSELSLNPDPDNPQHFYDYRAAYMAGAAPDVSGHWPSDFKKEGHPRMVINGVNTKTGEQTKEPGITEPEKEKPIELPQKVWDAYNTGGLSAKAKKDLENDIVSGKVIAPIEQEDKPGFLKNMWGAVSNVITGNDRKIPETEALPDWTEMPELKKMTWDAFKTGMATAFSDPTKTVETVIENHPGVTFRRDEKENIVFKSGEDGLEYAMKPGIDLNDVIKIGGNIIVWLMAGMKGGGLRPITIPESMLMGGIAQTAIEGSKEAFGGEGEMIEIPKTMAIFGGTEAVFRGIPALRNIKKAKTGTAEGIAKNVRTAVAGKSGKKTALRLLAEESKPDQKTLASGERLGISDYLQSDHVTTNQQYREVIQALKSIPGSEVRAKELEGFSQIAKRADDIIDELGGTRDLSRLDATIKTKIDDTVSALEREADDYSRIVNNAIPPKTEAPASNALDFINKRADELGGSANLSKEEKLILRRLTPTENKLPSGSTEITQPTYALLDQTRKDIGAALGKKQGPYRDGDRGLLKKLYSLLLDDQKPIAEKFNVGDEFALERASIKFRKSMEKDIQAVYGRELQKSIVGELSTAMKNISAGDITNFIKLMKAVPKDLREEATASGLATAFGINARNGQLNFATYSKWYEGLLNNRRAYNTLMVNLPPGSRKTLSDLYRVSKSISKSTRERITTGRSNLIHKQILGSDNLIGSIYAGGKKAAIYATARKITAPLGSAGYGLSFVLQESLTKGRSNALIAADKLISSPEFIYLARSIGTDAQEKAIKTLARTPAAKEYMRSNGLSSNLKDIQAWILSSIQTTRQLEE